MHCPNAFVAPSALRLHLPLMLTRLSLRLRAAGTRATFTQQMGVEIDFRCRSRCTVQVPVQGVILVFVPSSFPICTALMLWGHSRVLVLLGHGRDDRGAVLPDHPAVEALQGGGVLMRGSVDEVQFSSSRGWWGACGS